VLQCFGGQFEADKLTARLGDRYAFITNGFKPAGHRRLGRSGF
jgi:hypothetical protein